MFIIKHRPSQPANADVSLSFNFEHKTGAILGFFDTGVREISYVNYAEPLRKNIESWLSTARITNSDLADKDLRVVTDCMRVRSWAKGVSEEKTKEGQFSLSVGFGPLSAGAQLSKSIKYEGGSNIHHGPADRIMKLPVPTSVESPQVASKSKRKGKGKKQADKGKAGVSAPSLPGPSTSLQSVGLSLDEKKEIRNRSDQCIFMRSLRIKRRPMNLPLKIQAAAKPRDFRKDNNSDERVLPVLRDEGHVPEESDSEIVIETVDQNFGESNAVIPSLFMACLQLLMASTRAGIIWTLSLITFLRYCLIFPKAELTSGKWP
ncbi:hypothetical protein D9757_008324 [Collybiopsis confluens]|uniref:Uncharacterized protein n=1 Tax=Collybiopsis confluens TaxID=2823264 RepID=A0A8H5HEK9_9AGAR|nr:hypothetical protein D9757_008324 [Collybiopsis confluens]